MEKNICLIGFMGSGKSMIACELGRRLGLEVVAADELIEAKEGRRILDIFKTKGEAYFRDLEQKVIEEISQRRGIIIDCGGGVVLRKENLANLKSNGIVFYLQAAPEVIYERVKHEGHRPLLKGPDPLGCIKELYNQRLPLYNQADFVIDANDASIEGPVAEIIKKYKG
ncbi:MAG: shikimate kinase [Candidatus Omnitrophica bacterium]|nr:shikimate kinase [Candidatus Omnitrophota bacterium]